MKRDCPGVVSKNRQILAAACVVAVLLLVKTKHLLDDRQYLEPALFLITLFFWGQLTRDTGQHNPAVLWAILGTVLLLTGLAAKSRCFRLTASIILALSLGHLMIIDIVKLEPLPRILSFMTLGFGLLGLGYVYKRYQDRLKQIL